MGGRRSRRGERGMGGGRDVSEGRGGAGRGRTSQRRSTELLGWRAQEGGRATHDGGRGGDLRRDDRSDHLYEQRVGRGREARERRGAGRRALKDVGRRSEPERSSTTMRASQVLAVSLSAHARLELEADELSCCARRHSGRPETVPVPPPRLVPSRSVLPLPFLSTSVRSAD